MSLLKHPALLLTIALFVIAQVDLAADFVQKNDIAWFIYTAFTGLIVFIQSVLPLEVSGYTSVALQFGLQYVVFTLLFWVAKQVTRPIRWAIWILFFITSYTVYQSQFPAA